MKTLCVCTLLPLLAMAAETPEGMSPGKALERLAQGNRRFVAGRPLHPDQTIARRKALTAGQHPFAVILGCADSRVPPEIVFDQGLGDLFVIRDAGNVIDDEVLGSIEYAVEHAGVHLVVVLAHEKCGAVTAAVQGGEAGGHIKVVVEAIHESVEATKDQPGDKVHNCILDNARRTARLVRTSEPILKEFVAEGKLKVVAADYDLATGKVVFLDQEPMGK